MFTYSTKRRNPSRSGSLLSSGLGVCFVESMGDEIMNTSLKQGSKIKPKLANRRIATRLIFLRGRGYGLNWMETRTVIKPHEAVCWKYQEHESLTLASGHAATKEMFHFLRPPECSIFKERKGQELEFHNKIHHFPGSTLLIPVSLVIDKDSTWNSRWDDTSQVLMAFWSNERETTSWTRAAVIDWDPGGTSLEKVHEAGCLRAMEQRIFLKLSVTGMKRSSEADHVEEFEMRKRSVMRMKLPLVGEKTLQLTVDPFHSHVALVSVQLLFHFTRPPEVHLVLLRCCSTSQDHQRYISYSG